MKKPKTETKYGYLFTDPCTHPMASRISLLEPRTCMRCYGLKLKKAIRAERVTAGLTKKASVSMLAFDTDCPHPEERSMLRKHHVCEQCYDGKRRALGLGKRRVHDRAKILRAKYGITIERFNELYAGQGGVCALCDKSQEIITGVARDGSAIISGLHVDHDHKTGEVRGLLCLPCNIAISRIDKHGAAWATRAIDYLSLGHPQRETFAFVPTMEGVH